MIDRSHAPTRGTTAGLLRVCFVQAYRAPDYIRGRSICAALRASDRVELIEARNRSGGLARYWQAIQALLHARRHHDPDVYLLGFRGHEIAWLVRWLTRGKPLVIDAMMSPYASLSEESKFGWIGRALARAWRPYERAILHASDGVLTDTEGHAGYYRSQFDLSVEHLLAIPVGAEERIATVIPDSDLRPTDPLRVLFYGSFLPLHGVDVILAAAGQLASEPIEFRFLGGTHTQAALLRRRCESLGVTRYTHARWIAFDQILDEEIPKADLCLGGPFGDTPQAQRVVTGKTSQCMALGRPTVVGRISDGPEFIDRDNCLLVEQDNPDALADAIRWASDHREALRAIGERGRTLYQEQLSRAVLRDTLVPFLQRLAAGREGAT